MGVLGFGQKIDSGFGYAGSSFLTNFGKWIANTGVVFIIFFAIRGDRGLKSP